MRQDVPGGVRLVAHYLQFGRRASMVFYFRQPYSLAPTTAECQAVADAYGIWENNGLGIGYALLRGDDSHYVNVSCKSVDSSSESGFADKGFDRTGEIPGFVSPMLPSSLAPICRWATAERGLATGRTYLVGISEGITGMGADQEYLGPGAGAGIQVVMDSLRSVVQGSTGYIQSHFTASARGGLGIGQHLLDITGCGVYNLLGSQRRRTRPR